MLPAERLMLDAAALRPGGCEASSSGRMAKSNDLCSPPATFELSRTSSRCSRLRAELALAIGFARSLGLLVVDDPRMDTGPTAQAPAAGDAGQGILQQEASASDSTTSATKCAWGGGSRPVGAHDGRTLPPAHPCSPCSPCSPVMPQCSWAGSAGAPRKVRLLQACAASALVAGRSLHAREAPRARPLRRHAQGPVLAVWSRRRGGECAGPASKVLEQPSRWPGGPRRRSLKGRSAPVLHGAAGAQWQPRACGPFAGPFRAGGDARPGDEQAARVRLHRVRRARGRQGGDGAGAPLDRRPPGEEEEARGTAPRGSGAPCVDAFFPPIAHRAALPNTERRSTPSPPSPSDSSPRTPRTERSSWAASHLTALKVGSRWPA